MISIKAINIISICLQFFSFWLAAPEILGKEWLQKTEEAIKKAILTIPNLILMLLGLVIGYSFADGINNYSLKTIIPIGIVFILVLILSKKIKFFLDQRISTPLLKKLIINESFRFTLLKIAALMFTVGFILQIIATIYS